MRVGEGVLLKISTRSWGWGQGSGRVPCSRLPNSPWQPIWPFSMANGLQRKKKKYTPSHKKGREGEGRERGRQEAGETGTAKETLQAHNAFFLFFFFLLNNNKQKLTLQALVSQTGKPPHVVVTTVSSGARCWHSNQNPGLSYLPCQTGCRQMAGWLRKGRGQTQHQNCPPGVLTYPPRLISVHPTCLPLHGGKE